MAPPNDCIKQALNSSVNEFKIGMKLDALGSQNVAQRVLLR